MAFEQHLFNLTLFTEAELEDIQYLFVKMVDAEVMQIEVAEAGDFAIGVAQDERDDDEDPELLAIAVRTLGVTKVVAGATIASGELIASDANGKAVEATSGDYALGVCLIGADANEIASVYLVNSGIVPNG